MLDIFKVTVRIVVLACFLLNRIAYCNILLLGAGGGSTASLGTVSLSEEFVGPFSSWLNVQTGCGGAGAVGNGSTDDTAAIQRCLTALSSSTPVVYFPAPSVNYKITSTLTVFGQTQIMVVGADPATTIIKWGGASDGTMLSFSNNSNSRVLRLTFDGNNSAKTAIVEDWDNVHNYFDQGNLYSDIILKNNTQIAFYCGLTAGCADIPMVRMQFINNGMGAFVGDQNALDLNIWYSLFDSNAQGAGNYYLAGNINGGGSFNVFNSVFLSSSSADNYIANPLYESFRNNYSSNSGYFVRGGGGCGSSNVTLQNNTILDPVTAAHNLSDRGPLLLLDNKIRSTASPTIVYGACTTGDALSLGNTFTAGTIDSGCASSSPIKVKTGGTVGRCRSVTEPGGGDQVISTGTFNATVNTNVPTLPPTPPNRGRTIYETNPSTGTNNNTCSLASPCTVQAAVCKAATGSNGFSAGACTGTVVSSRTVVHLLPVNYTISATIAVPASDIQIIGDGLYSQLVASGLSGAPVFKLAGPSQVVMRDFNINGSIHTADGIEIDNADQAGALIFGQLIGQGDYTGSAIYSDSLSHAVIEMHSIYVTENTSNTTNGGIRVVGSGSNVTSQVNVFDALMTGNYIGYNVSSDGRLLVEDCWCSSEGEGPFVGLSGHHLATVTGSGAFTFNGGIIGIANQPSDATFAVSNFTGNFAFANAITNGEMAFTGTGTGANNMSFGPLNSYRAIPAGGTVTSGSPTISFAAGPPFSIPTGSWVNDFSNPSAIPSSLISPSTVVSINTGAHTVTMTQNAVGNSLGGGDAIAFYSAVPFSDSSSGSTNGNLNPLTGYNDGTNQDPQELPEIGSSGTTFLTTSLAQLRSAKPRLPLLPQSGITNVEMYNLGIGFIVNGIHIKP